MNLKTAFKEFGKQHILNYLKIFWGYEFAAKQSVSSCIDAFSENQQKQIAEHITGYQDCPDFWNREYVGY